MAIMNWAGYHLSMNIDVGENMAPHSTGIDGFYSSPRSWILERSYFPEFTSLASTAVLTIISDIVICPNSNG